MELRIDIFTALSETVKVIDDPYKRSTAYSVLMQALNDIFHNKLVDEVIDTYSPLFDAYNITYTAVTETEEIETATVTETIQALKEGILIDELATVTEDIVKAMVGLDLTEPVTVTELIELLKAIPIDETVNVTETIDKAMIGLEIFETPSVTETIEVGIPIAPEDVILREGYVTPKDVKLYPQAI